ncbi:hypothetical protein D9623_03770 [Azospirillum brasilense]|nr:hypothetical protein FE88_10510 [Azospirillum brasilense]QCO08693.1 hypothetical protein D3868_06325 [Azospirillum brasilense]QEL89325.1 hypothetical protein D9621_03765 [Azospirillum brasilense]QEL95574.1 hypothetical protein D9623_03770 [Azospirillum brasilense]RIW00872.1 hypothetical protein D2T81_19670 [Azospirillum brasilense]
MSGPELSHGAIGPGGSKVIPFHPAPAAAVSPAPSLPRRPAVPSPARADGVAPPAESTPRPERLARLIYMASVGGYMAVREDTLVELGGRMVWPTADALIRDAAAAGVPVSSHVINTARS